MWGLGQLKGVRNDFLGDMSWKRSLSGGQVQEDRHPSQVWNTAELRPPRVQCVWSTGHSEQETARGDANEEGRGIDTLHKGLGKHGQQKKAFSCGTFDKMVFLKNISDTNDGKRKQTSKTRRPEAQLGTCCHCKGRKLHKAKTQARWGRADI